MRLYAPLYEGDSILRPDATIGAPVRTVFKTPAPAPDFVRSNIQVEAANETMLDLHAIEQTARAEEIPVAGFVALANALRDMRSRAT